MDFKRDNLFTKVKDYSVSKEIFELHYDQQFDMLSTFPRPDNKALYRYYESDDYISHTDAKRSLFEKTYHLVKNIALRNKLNLVNSLKNEKGSLLDFGAGTGDFLSVMKKNEWEVTGIEPSKKAIDLAKQKGIILLERIEDLKPSSFDVITLWHVLEHIPDLDNQIKNFKKLLKPNAYLIVAVPNFKSFDAEYYKEFWAAYDVPRHLWHFSKTAIQKLFEKEGIILEKVLPMKFDSFYVSMLSEKYKTGKTNYLKAFLIGMQSNWKAKKSQEYSSHIYILKNIN